VISFELFIKVFANHFRNLLNPKTRMTTDSCFEWNECFD